MDKRYTLGLDIGIASIGWAVLLNDCDGEPFKIERLGVRTFDLAEGDKGASPASKRREARGQRRVTRRRKHRKERIKNLIHNSNIMPREQIAELMQRGRFESSVYELRVEALERRLSDEEIVRLMLHYAQRRGYRSNSKSEEAKKGSDSGKVKAAISANRAVMQEHSYRAIGEMLLKDEKFWETRPDGSRVFVPHNSPDNYRATVERSMVEEEIRLVFQRQRELGTAWLTEEFEEKYLSIWGGQRNFDEGPGGNSKYGGDQIEKMLGRCTFEPNEYRAPKGSYSAEYFRLLQDANNLRLTSADGRVYELTEEQRNIYRPRHANRQRELCRS